MSQPTPIPVTVIGIGHLGRHHLRLACTLAGWHCVGAYDADRSRLEELCREHGARPLASVRQAVELAQAVVIATPTVTHCEIAEQALAAGCHVLVEKPIAATVAEAERMVECAAHAGRALGVGHVEFFNPAVQAVLAAGPRPRFIETQRLSQFTKRSLDIDVVLDLMVHDIQIAQALVGGAAVREVRAAGVPVLSPRADLANVRLEFSDGTIASLTASRVSTDRVRKLRLFARDEYFSLDYADQTVSAFRLVRGEGEPRIEPMSFPVEKAEPLAAEHVAFQRACRGEVGAFVDGRAGAAALDTAVKIVDAIVASSTP